MKTDNSMMSGGMPPRGLAQLMSSSPGGPTPGAGAADDAGEEMGEASEVCVPLQALAQPDDQEQMTTPAVGDSGSMSVDYTVTRIEGENAYVKPSAVNGTPLAPSGGAQEDKGAAAEPDDAAEEANLRGQLAGQ